LPCIPLSAFLRLRVKTGTHDLGSSSAVDRDLLRKITFRLRQEK
jgi:hypothetical protein